MYAEKSENNGLMWMLMGAYGRVGDLYKDGYYREAGEQLALSFFPTKQEKMGNV